MNKVFLILTIFISACSSSNQLEYALERAQTNRPEMEKVLCHYTDSEIKYRAAQYLISNMPASFGNLLQTKEALQPLYTAYDSINQMHNYQVNNGWGEQIDNLYKVFPELLHTSYIVEDLRSIEAEYLIEEIERSFKAWRRNVYSKDCSFETFCEYILPYRRLNGLIADQARDTFYQRHITDYFNDEKKHWQNEIDSLLYEYKHLTHSQFHGIKIPILSAKTFENLRHGLCIHRCWYNSLLLSSLGMPIAIDFVPAWGNRNNSHTWNVIILDNKSYAFEAFWDNDRWKYKRIYNNQETDLLWGKFRLPKVYRHTYSNHPEGPVEDPSVERTDIPALFRNVKKKDVSDEYFETQDVTIKLTEKKPKDTKYAYLAVFGYQQWHPVQWGKINEDGTITFKGMGKDIVYLPIYYKNGEIIPAAQPFKIEANGNIRSLFDNGTRGTICLRIITGAPAHDKNLTYLGKLCGSRLIGLEDGKPHDELLIWNDSLEMNFNKKEIESRNAYQRVRMYLPTDTIALGDIAFYTKEGRISSIKIISNMKNILPSEDIKMLTDGIEATAYQGITFQKSIDFDFERPVQLTGIGIYPYLNSQISKEDNYSLWYWDNGWKVFETKENPSNGYVEFKDVPLNTLMMLKNLRWEGATAERTFIYNNESICWE